MIDNLKCGCGKPVKYLMGNGFENGSCNKYMRCPTYEELQEYTKKLNNIMYNYRFAFKQIREYIENEGQSLVDCRKINYFLEQFEENIKQFK